MVKLVYIKEIDEKIFSETVFITGFQGFGLVGYLTTRHIVSELGLEKIGFIKTKYMPEITFYTNRFGLIYPFELYYGEVFDKKITVLLNHSIPIRNELTKYTEFIAEWAKSRGVSMAILIGGLDPSIKESSEEEYRWIPISNYNGNLDAPILNERYVIGPLALTMMFLNARNVPGVAIFAYTEMYRPDPRASAVAVKTVSKILGIEIDTRKLLEEAAVIESIEEERRKFMRMVEEGVRTGRRNYTMHV
ncbi:MAG: PAC2 family protein [Desulfurococcaceae archaeon]